MMSQDSVKVLFIGVACGLLFSIPLSIIGGAAVFFFLDGIREEPREPAAAPPRAASPDRAPAERPQVVERPSPEPQQWRPSPLRRGHGRFLDRPAPTFQTTTLEGDLWRLADHRGQVVVLDFWASWCQPCIKKIPELREVYERYRDRSDFLMIGVSLDRDRKALEDCMVRHGVEWPQLFEEGKDWGNSVAQLYEVRAIPHVLVIDRQGIVRAYPRGASLATDLARLLPVEASELASASTKPRFTPPTRRAGRLPAAPAVRALSGTMRHRGAPMPRWSSREPRFWLRVSNRYASTRGVELDYDEETGSFEMRKLPTAATLELAFAENGHWGSLPGDYRATVDYNLDQSQDADIVFEKILRLLEPWDNADASRHSADPWLTFTSPLRFEWEPVAGAAEYRVFIILSRDAAHAEGYGYVESAVDRRLEGTSFTAALPPSEPYEHYEFSMFAYDDSEERIAYYMSTYSNRYDYTRSFKVADDQ